MTISINHTPIGLGLQMAAQMGQAEGNRYRQGLVQQALADLQARTQQALQLRQQISREDAFKFQNAAADRIGGTPTARAQAKYFPSRAELYAQSKQGVHDAEQKALDDQLQSMLDRGIIDQSTYEQNKARVIGGQDVQFSSPSTAAPKSPPLSVARQPFEDQRRQINAELRTMQDWETAYGATQWQMTQWGSYDAAKKRRAELYQQLDAVTQREQQQFGLTTPATSGTMETSAPVRSAPIRSTASVQGAPSEARLRAAAITARAELEAVWGPEPPLDVLKKRVFEIYSSTGR